MQPKIQLRLKAMQGMMKQKPEKSYKKPVEFDDLNDLEDLKDGGSDEDKENEQEKEGYEQMMVSPEEKQMILERRKKLAGKKGSKEEILGAGDHEDSEL